MNTTEYFFKGRKKIGEFSYTEKKGKIKISVESYEQWDNIYFRDIACGEKITNRFEKKIGISKQVKENLESILKGGVGVKGLANIESQIKGQISTTFTFEHSITKEDRSEIEAPKCGRRILDIWQKSRIFYIEILDSRYFSSLKGCNTHCIYEHLEFYHDNGKVHDFDPMCACDDKYPTPDDGFMEFIIDNKYIIRSVFRKLEKDKILLESIGLEVTSSELGQMIIDDFTINTNILPNYITFLGGLKNNAKLRLRNHQENSLEFGNDFRKVEEVIDTLRKSSINLTGATALAGAAMPMWIGKDPLLAALNEDFIFTPRNPYFDISQRLYQTIKEQQKPEETEE